jgi:hypothetical protein
MIGAKYTIVREGEGYEVIISKPNAPVPYNSSIVLFYGTPTQIMTTYTPSYADMVYMFPATSDENRSALRQLAGEITERYRMTLSSDGRSVEYVTDDLKIFGTGSSVKYKIVPFARASTLVRAPQTASVKKTETSAVAQIESRGEFYFLAKDGRKLTGKDVNQITLEEGTKVVTGSSGHVQMKLPDDTTFTVGPNSDLVIDKFVYDADKNPKTIMANLSKGVFRWVTGKVARKDPAEMKVKLPVGDLGIRGTDFEVAVESDGSGFVMLYFGQLEITEKKTGFKFILDAGQKVTFGADGSISRPMKAD